MGLSSVVITFLISFLSLTAESTQPPYSCDASFHPRYPFCNPELPITQRAKDLVSRLTLDEKLAQLVNTAPSIPRLGIPSYQWWSEALHGVADAGLGIRLNGTIKGATSFPQVILTAATFDQNLWYQIGKAIGTEARAVYNAGQATGMTFWAPNINVFRDPRWGRGQETAGEDPLMNAKYGVAYVRGLQGDSFHGGKLGERLQASACCKHFTAYDLDQWKGINRFVFDARVTSQDLADTYQPPFQSCIEKGRASGIMCAYNRVNGVPNCADFNLLTKTARKQWKFDGYITSDCGAVSIIHDEQGYAKTAEDAIADVFRAGMDVECGDYISKHGKSAVVKKKLGIGEMERALENLFSMRIRLGLFDGNPTKLPFGSIGPRQVCSKEHLHLALDAARDGMVLLKNTNSLLPLPKTNPTLALIGPNANATSLVALGNYYGRPCNLVTLLQAFQGYAKDTRYHPGCHNGTHCDRASIQDALDLAKNVDYVVLVMGLDQNQERESHDRHYLGLPGKQEQLIHTVAAVAKRPVVLVLLSGGPVDITSAKFDHKVGGILWAGYPGELGGLALAQVIFGDHNPGGKLPITWYPKDYIIKVPMTDMRMRADPATGYPGRTYRFYTGPKVYEFGYGLSYTNYSHNLISLSQTTLHINISSTHYYVTENSETIRVTNHGSMSGKHPVLLFTRQGKVRNGNPVKQLVGFESVKVDAGETVQVGFQLSLCEHFSRANEGGSLVIEEGSYSLVVEDHEYPINITL
uniref:Beta-D-xylosidase 7 n=1 Tax=Cajanus cajan TaxID=3821 RepID=A0A151TZR9_CAJCA|nr:putative beta-D-xylosidase 7 [Cajanus cajan]